MGEPFHVINNEIETSTAAEPVTNRKRIRLHPIDRACEDIRLFTNHGCEVPCADCMVSLHDLLFADYEINGKEYYSKTYKRP